MPNFFDVDLYLRAHRARLSKLYIEVGNINDMQVRAINFYDRQGREIESNIMKELIRNTDRIIEELDQTLLFIDSHL